MPPDTPGGLKDIEVQVTFDEMTAKDHEELGKYAPAGVATFTAWKRRSPDGGETLSANSKSYAPFNLVREKASAADKKAEYSALRTADASLGLPAWTSQDAASQAMVAWEADHTSLLAEAPEFLQTNFFGFNSGGKMSGLFDFVLVTADLRASEESLDGKASIVGRILERSVDRTAADEEISKIVEDSRTRQQKVYEDKFKAQLETMTAELNAVVATYSPGRAITVTPSEVELKAPRTTFEVAVLDGSTETSVERQGHGFQRTLLISALQLLAQSGSASADGVICLAIEEPELFQHPIQAQTFAKVLRSLAEDTSKRIQVTYATHSPFFLEASHFDQVRRLTRSADEVPVITIHSATIDSVKAKLTGTTAADVVDRQLDGLVTNRLSTALFAHRALLVEGETESAVFYGVGDRQKIGSLEAVGIAVVPMGGKGNLPFAHAILTSLGIPTYVVFDGDGGFEARAISLGKSQATIDAERTKFVAENRRILRYLGQPEVDFPPQNAGTNLATLSDQLESYLEANWPEWVTACEAVEVEAQIELKKNQGAYRQASLEAGGAVPALLLEILSKAEVAL